MFLPEMNFFDTLKGWAVMVDTMPIHIFPELQCQLVF